MPTILTDDPDFRNGRHAITAAATGDSITAQPGSGFERLCNKGLFRTKGNYGITGQRMDQILARAPTDALVSGADFLFTNGGVNDIEQSRTESLLRADVEALWNAALTKGIQPLDWNLCPRGSVSGTLVNRRIVHNLWRNLRARQLGIPHKDVHSRLSDATGLYASGYNADDLHPNGRGYSVLGTAIQEMLAGSHNVSPLRAPTDTRISDSSVGITVWDNQVSLTDTNADGVADGMFASGASGVYAIENALTGVGDKGKWQKCTIAGLTGVGLQWTALAFSTLGWAIGDKIALSFGLRAKADSGQSLSLSAAYGSTTVTGNNFTSFPVGDIAEENFDVYNELTITGGTSWTFFLTGTGSGYFSINRLVAVNMTKLGLT